MMQGASMLPRMGICHMFGSGVDYRQILVFCMLPRSGHSVQLKQICGICYDAMCCLSPVRTWQGILHAISKKMAVHASPGHAFRNMLTLRMLFMS